jgi:hypothetical protein
MTVQTWNDWVKLHAALTGARTRQAFDGVVLLGELFKGRGVTPAELAAASEAAILQPPRYASGWAAALAEQLRLCRGKAGALSPFGERGTCTRCGNTGVVIVPHPRVYVRPKPWYTLGVGCRCAAGRRWYDAVSAYLADRRGGKALTLDRYEELYRRDWAETLWRHDHERSPT